ncbi:MAG: CsgG/HfaB family protein [Phascolarctobacterium sp.]
MIKILLAFLFVLMSNQCFAAVDVTARIAVMDFGTRPGASTHEINIQNAEYTSSEYLINRLANSNCFIVVDKDLAFSKIKAHGHKTVGLIDPDTAKCIGKTLNVKYLLYGNIAGVTSSNTGTAVVPLGTGVSVNVCTIKAHMVARLMDIATGDILLVIKGDGSSKSSFVKGKAHRINIVQVGTKKVTQDSVHNAIMKAAYNVIDKLLLSIEGTKGKKSEKSTKKEG